MAKKPELTLKDLQTAAALDDLPTMRPLLAEVERLTAELETLDKEALRLSAHRSPSLYELGKLTERRAPIEAALVEAKRRVRDEEARLREQIDQLVQPVMLDTVTRYVAALDKAVPLEEELRAVESLRQKFIPQPTATRARDMGQQLRQLVHYLGEQTR
jgi:hypothetical protein